jgi:hypothetical protein
MSQNKNIKGVSAKSKTSKLKYRKNPSLIEEKGFVGDLVKGLVSHIGRTAVDVAKNQLTDIVIDKVTSPLSRLSLSRPKTQLVRAPRERKLRTPLEARSAPAAIGFEWNGLNNKQSPTNTVIEHTEIIETSVTGSVNYSVPYTYDINPGNSLAFPWGSGISRLFELYEFDYLEFFYTPSCATDTIGMVCLYFDPDCQDTVPPSMEYAMNARVVTASSAWRPCSIRVPTKLLKAGATNAKYVEVDNSASVDYSKTLGQLHVLTQGNSASDALGILGIRYKIKLRVPQLHTLSSTEGYLHLSGSSITTSDIFTYMNASTDSNLDQLGVTWTGITLTFPEGMTGSYHMWLQIAASTSVLAWTAGPNYVGGISGHATFAGNGALNASAWRSSAQSGSTTSTFLCVDFHLDGTGAEIKLGSMGAISGACFGDCLIYQLPSSHDSSLYDRCAERAHLRRLKRLPTRDVPDSYKDLLSASSPSDCKQYYPLFDKLLTPLTSEPDPEGFEVLQRDERVRNSNYLEFDHLLAQERKGK